MKALLLALWGFITAINILINQAPIETEETIETVTEEYIPSEPEETIPTVSYYNVDLSPDVQNVIFKECEKYDIDPSIVIAMIEKESHFNPSAIGDNGKSFGLMQIQPRWHSKRMELLGCTDLLDPVQNVTVGIDYLGEMYIRYGDIGLALTAYNSGSAKNGLNGYAVTVMAMASEM